MRIIEAQDYKDMSRKAANIISAINEQVRDFA